MSVMLSAKRLKLSRRRTKASRATRQAARLMHIDMRPKRPVASRNE